MELQPDFKELLELLNENSVKYLIIGGYAVAFYGAPRFTGDLDIYIQPTRENAEKLMKSLLAFGFGGLDLSVADFINPERVVQLGLPPVRIDFITSIDGVTWEEAWTNRVSKIYAGIDVMFIGRNELIRNKMASARKRDLSDVEALCEQSEPSEQSEPREP